MKAGRQLDRMNDNYKGLFQKLSIMTKFEKIKNKIKGIASSTSEKQQTSINLQGQMDKETQFILYIVRWVLPECKKGNLGFFDIAQNIFMFSSEKQLQVEIAIVNEELLRDISIKKLLWLSENFRKRQDDYYYIGGSWKINRNIDLNKHRWTHLTDSQYYTMLKLGTFTSNGFYRQQCMEQLDNAEGSLPFLILRMNDWVIQIRECAYGLVLQRMQKCGIYEIFMSLPVLEKVKKSKRRETEQIYLTEMQVENTIQKKFQEISDIVLDEIPAYEIPIKNAIYRFINRSPVLKREQMEKLLTAEKTGYGQMLIVMGIFRHYGYDHQLLERYLYSKSAVVRYHTLVYRYEQEHSAWSGLEKMLLDPSKRIRDYASYILQKYTDINLTDFYLDELHKNVSKTVLLGLLEHGENLKIDIIKPYLESSSEQICKAALEAYGKFDEKGREAVYWRFLFDERLVIARQAYRLIRRYQIQYGAAKLYEAYMNKCFTPMSTYFLKLLLSEPSWTRLPYLLMLYRKQDIADEEQMMISAGICSRRNMYAKVSKQQAEAIYSLLEENMNIIPEYVSKGILFDLKCVTK